MACLPSHYFGLFLEVLYQRMVCCPKNPARTRIYTLRDLWGKVVENWSLGRPDILDVSTDRRYLPDIDGLGLGDIMIRRCRIVNF